MPQPGPTPTWHATVSFHDEANLEARVEIHRSAADGPLLSVREITFEEGDSLEQRYRALGLLIVSHVLAADPLTDTPPTRQVAPPEPTPAPPPEKQWGLDGAATIGPGFEDPEFRLGGFLRLWVNPFEVPIRPLAAIGWSGSSGLAEGTWLDASLGVALRVEPTPEPFFALELRAEGVAEHLQLSAERDGLMDHRTVQRFGARLGVDAHLEVARGFGVFVGGQGSYLLPRVRTLTVAGESVGGERAPTWTIVAGLRISR